MWDFQKYRSAIKGIKQSGVFLGKKVKTQEDIYKALGDKIGFSDDTVKSWSRKTSRGPGNDAAIAEVEQALGLNEGELGRKEEKQMNWSSQAAKLTEFNKQAILNCYMLMKEYIHADGVEHEECFANMCAEVEKYRIAIPEEIYEEIQGCIDEFLAPIVYEKYDTFAQCYTKDIAYIDDDGQWQTRDEEATRKSCMYFIMKLAEIEENVDDFAMEKLYPILNK